MLLLGVERVFPPQEQEQRVANANSLASNTSIENAAKKATVAKTVSIVSTISATLSVHKCLLPVIELEFPTQWHQYQCAGFVRQCLQQLIHVVKPCETLQS